MAMRKAEEELFYARDAYSSASLLAAIVLLAGAMTALRAPAGLVPLVLGLRGAQAALSAVALIFMTATRSRPRGAVAVIYCALVIGLQFFVLPANAYQWHMLGRDWETFTGAQLAIASVALVVPRSYRFGLAAVLLLTLETMLIYVVLREI